MRTGMKQQPKTRPTIAVIGMGNWGSSLAHALERAGVTVEEKVVSPRRRLAASASACVPFDKARLTADILWLCVPDAAIPRVTRQLAQRMVERSGRNKGQHKGQIATQVAGQIVVHSSGALSSAILLAAATAGASIASVHPVMSFPSRKPVALQGVPFGVEADAATRRRLYAVVRQIGGRPFAIKTSTGATGKALYHAAGMLASPLLVSHLVAAQQAAELAGFSPGEARQLIEPIARATLDNVFRKGARKSFSGPIARADLATIQLHLQALELHPMLREIYRSLGLYALDVLPASARKAMIRVLSAKSGSRVRNSKRPDKRLHQ